MIATAIIVSISVKPRVRIAGDYGTSKRRTASSERPIRLARTPPHTRGDDDEKSREQTLQQRAFDVCRGAGPYEHPHDEADGDEGGGTCVDVPFFPIGGKRNSYKKNELCGLKIRKEKCSP